MNYRILEDTLTASGDIAAANTSTALDLKYARGLYIFSKDVLVADTAKTFVDGNVSVANDTITIASHNFATGRKVAATTDGVLPGGLSATNYFVIVVSATVIKLASSAANALLGTAVDITSAAGGGTHTLTPAAITGASILLQGSINNSDYFTIPNTSTNITATANVAWNIDSPYYRYIQAVIAMGAGQITHTLTYRILSRARDR